MSTWLDTICEGAPLPLHPDNIQTKQNSIATRSIHDPKICCIYNKTLNCNCIEEEEGHFDYYLLFVYPKFMAPTLTSSNSFLLNPTPHSRLIVKNPRFSVFAKKAGPFPPFQLGKSKDENPSDESSNGVSGNSNPFRFNFGTVRDVKSLIPVVSGPGTGLSFGNSRRKDPGTVFVAGATGQAGIRIAQSLLREGFSVRAGVPELGAAQELARLAASYKVSFLNWMDQYVFRIISSGQLILKIKKIESNKKHFHELLNFTEQWRLS